MITFSIDIPDETCGGLPCVFQEEIDEDDWVYEPLITAYHGQDTLVIDTVGRVIVRECPDWTFEMLYRLGNLANEGQTMTYRLLGTSPLSLEEMHMDYGTIDPCI